MEPPPKYQSSEQLHIPRCRKIHLHLLGLPNSKKWTRKGPWKSQGDSQVMYSAHLPIPSPKSLPPNPGFGYLKRTFGFNSSISKGRRTRSSSLRQRPRTTCSSYGFRETRLAYECTTWRVDSDTNIICSLFLHMCVFIITSFIHTSIFSYVYMYRQLYGINAWQ